MAVTFHIHFKLGGQDHAVSFTEQSEQRDARSVLIGGAWYEMQGDEEGVALVQSCLEAIRNPGETPAQIGKELKARLWQVGAEEIVLLSVKEIHRIGLQALAPGETIDVPRVIHTICKLLEQRYIFPEIAKKCEEYLQNQLSEGAYDGISDLDALAQAVTADLRLISEDKHIVVCQAGPPPIQEPYPLPQLEHAYTYNLGIVPDIPYEIQSGFLEQNPKIGYVDLRCFLDYEFDDEWLQQDMEMQQKFKQDVETRRQSTIAAVQNIRNAESIVIDLRNNTGGDPKGVQFFCSLFIDEGIPLNEMEWREDDTFIRKEFQTLSHKELALDQRLLGVKVFILISPNTFSAGEELANNMKVLGRATLVGEPSRGGANPGAFFPVTDSLDIFIPTGRAINPFEGTNWEGVGVIPDYMVPAEDALELAIRLSQNDL